MSQQITVAVDAFGSDHGLAIPVQATLLALKNYPDLSVILVGDKNLIDAELQASSYDDAYSKRLQIKHTSEFISMDEEPTQALRRKHDSSMRYTVELVKQKEAMACVSGGNTGALMAISRYVLRTFPGIERAAITAMVPTIKGHIYMLDLGANIDCKAEQLFQFAVMGSLLVQLVDNIKSPRVALLNVGTEAIKGNNQIKAANAMLNQSRLNYVGYVEGNQLYKQPADVVISDGFVGNIALKTMEGVASFIMLLLNDALKSNIYMRTLGALAKPSLQKIHERINLKHYNGASLLGLQGIVIKSHGRANVEEFTNAIGIARLQAMKQMPKLLDKELEAAFKDISL